MDQIIKRDRSIIPACDVDLTRFEVIVRETAQMDEVGAYKIGAVLALSAGIRRVVDKAREYTSKPLIYDHQKGATDIPETGAAFAKLLKESGIDAFILFPLSGPATQAMWIQAAQDVDLRVIVGAHMTHEKFLVSQGGYLSDQSVDQIFSLAHQMHVKDFVVPGNKADVIGRIRTTLLDAGVNGATFYAPGFIAQSGNISEAAAVAGPRWHAIVGRAIYQAQDIQKAVRGLASAL